VWFRADGKRMEAKDWEDGGWMRTLGMFINGLAPEIRDSEGRCVQDADFLLLLNAHHEPVSFRISHELHPSKWLVAFDTARPTLPVEQEAGQAQSTRESRGALFRRAQPCPLAGSRAIACNCTPDFPLERRRRCSRIWPNLGISHVYLSPCLQAVPGSQHGYDVTDPGAVSADLGGEPAWTRFIAQARRTDLRILLDIVPNHMSASQHNPWWDNVLAHGPFSEFAEFFDIRNRSDQPFRVQICSLARPYGEAIDAGELKLEVTDGLPRVRHYDNTWPLAPASWGTLLSAAAGPPPSAASSFDGLERLRALPEASCTGA
jgi:hypothetical protein